MIYGESDYLLLSGIQHFAFCPRQWALIHIEEQWNENYLTASGRIMHTKAHNGDSVEKRGNTLIYRGLKVSSSVLGISGECDVVEFYKSDKGIPINSYNGLWVPYPVEYKRGKSKFDDCDRLQLCAQAVCLEEMLNTNICKGSIFYGEPRKREVVEFTEELRKDLFNIVKRMHELFLRKYTPNAIKGKFCNKCSIKDMCLPFLADKKDHPVTNYIEEHIE